MNKLNNYFTTNQFLTLQNLHGGGKISMKTPVNKKVCKELLYIIDI